MYKFKSIIIDKHSHSEKVSKSNNMTQLITGINKARNIYYSIVRTCDNRTMLRGSK